MFKNLFAGAMMLFATGASAMEMKPAMMGEPNLQEAVVAGGCFWCVEKDFEVKLPGVIEAISGYSGGDLKDPTYYRHTGHREVVKVVYDANVVSYKEIVDFHYRHIDWEDNTGSFCDRGHAYTSAVYYNTPEEMAAALEVAPKGSTVPVLPAKTFYMAEDYHQNYYKVNPVRYNFYRYRCGRDARVEELNGK